VRREAGVTIAPCKPVGQPQAWINDRWQPSETPVFYAAEELRERLSSWVGPIQFRLRLTRREGGDSPQVKQVVVGYEVGRNFLDYLMEFALKQFLSIPATLTRFALSNLDGTAVPVPPGLNQEKIAAVRVLVPEQRIASGTIATDRILLDEAVPTGQPVELQLSYIPRVEHDVGIYQIEEVPCVLLRLLNGENYRKPIAQDWVRTAGDRAKLLELVQFYDQPIEVEIFGSTLADVKSIHQALLTQIRQGKFDAPAYGLPVFVVGRAGLEVGDRLQKIGTLFSVRFRLILKDLWDGESIETLETVNKIEIGFPTIEVKH
jgi:hypothetical protein